MNAALTPPDNPLATLLARSALGDADSFAHLYDATSPRVYGLVLRVVRDPALAEQVTREVFLQAWLDARHYQAPACPVTWLMSSAHRHAVDSVRETEAAASGLDWAHVAPAPAREAALSVLSLAEREALELAYLDGYTHTEVAALVGAPVGGVRALIRDGLLRLTDAWPEPA